MVTLWKVVVAVFVCSLVIPLGFVSKIEADNPLSLDWPIQSRGLSRGILPDHHGLDILRKLDAELNVRAAASGEVIFAGFTSQDAGGNVVKLKHTQFDGGTYYTWYAHLSQIDVVVGSTVSRGESIGLIGCTGSCSGEHVHFQLTKDNQYAESTTQCTACLNPCEYLVGIVGGCGIDGTIPTPTAIADPTAVPTPIPTATADPTANDHDPPTGGIVDAPIAANHTLTIKATARDASGIRQVQLKIWPTGGVDSYIDLTHTGGETWETSINVDQHPSGTVLNFMLRAWDASINNNTAQLTGTHTVTVVKDTERPTGHYTHAPTTVDSTLTVRAEITDPSGVAKATLHSTIGTYEMSHEGTNIWSVTVDTGHLAVDSTFTYNIHASDVWGNGGQVTGGSGTVTVLRDTTAPTGYYINAPSVAGASLVISAHLEDPSGVYGATLHSGIGTFEMVREGTTDTWSVTVETGHLALGTTFNYNIHARDTKGNSVQVTGNQPVTVDDREPPTGHLVNVNPYPYNNLVIQAEFNPDLSGVAWVHAKYKIGNGGWQTKNMPNLYSNHWELNMDIRYVPHGTRIEYYVFAGDSAGNSAQTTGIQPVYVACPGVVITTWCAEYYNNTTLTGTPAYSKGEGGLYIERNYGAYEPEGGRGGLGNDNFSIRWSKVVDFGTNFFNFSTVSDDGVRVFVNESVVINERHPGGDLRYTVNKFVPAGKYVVVLEYVEYGGLAHVKFTW